MPKNLLSLSLLSLACALATNCGSGESAMSETEACIDLDNTYCDKLFNCYTKEEMASVQDQYGLNATDCKTKLHAQDCNPDAVKCDLGQTYHPDKAVECVSLFKGLSCNDMRTDPLPLPAACSILCSN